MANRILTKSLITVLCTMIFITNIFSGTFESESSGIYPQISVENMQEKLSAAITEERPFLFAKKSDFERISTGLAQSESFVAKQYEDIKIQAARYLPLEPEKITIDMENASYFSRGVSALDIVMKCAFVYLVEGIDEYAQRAYEEALYFANLPTWGRYQYLDNNHAALTVALCYDWLYDWLGKTDGRREQLADALWQKHLNDISALFADPDAKEYQSSFYQWYFSSNNHAVLDNCYTFLAALAVSDTDILSSAGITVQCLSNLEKVFDRIAPDSGWYEGVSYWNNVGPALGKLFSSMEAAFGTTFGYEDIDYITSCPVFPIYCQSTIGNFMYSDGVSSGHISAEMYYFGKMGNNDNICQYVTDSGLISPLLCLWYEEKQNNETNFEPDKLFKNVSVATMRSTWNGSQEIFTGMAVQKASETHAYMNSGTFVLDALGERWVSNPGRDSYELDGYWENSQNGKRWKYYCTRAEANSCVVINPTSDGGQVVNADDTIDVFESGEDGAFCISDLSATYAEAREYKRGIKLYDDRSRVVLQDEMTLLESSEVYSFINVYKSDVELTSDGAILSKGNKKIYVKIISDSPFELELMEASPLSTSPNPEGQTDFTGDFDRLAIHFKDVSKVNVSVTFVPYFADDVPILPDSFEMMDLWNVETGTSGKPQLDSVTINGEAPEGFNPEQLYYKIYLQDFKAEIIARSSENYAVEIVDDIYNSCYKIRVTDNASGAQNVYLIDVGYMGEITADTFIGGSISNNMYMTNTNYGSQSVVTVRDNSKYSLLGYYKIKLPKIPEGKKIKKAELVLHQYRITDSQNPERYKFFLIDPDLWDEGTITYNNAPLRHSYSDDWYPFKLKDELGNYTAEAVADMSVVTDRVYTVPRGMAVSENAYKSISYDVTRLVEALPDKQSEMSFVIGIPNESYRTLATNHIVSKEHENASLRPQFYIETEAYAESFYATGVELVEEDDDMVHAQVHVINETSDDKEFFVCTAVYDENKRLIDVKFTKMKSQSFGEGYYSGESLKLTDDAANIKVFVFDTALMPMYCAKQWYGNY